MMKNIKWGLSQIKAETPAFANWTFRIVLYVCGAAAIIVGGYTQIPKEIKLEVLQYCSETTLIVHALTRMFGLTVKGPDDGAAQK